LASVRLKLKSSSLHGNISLDDSARELFKPSKDLAKLRFCNEKTFLVSVFFVSDAISGVILGLFGPIHLDIGSNR